MSKGKIIVIECISSSVNYINDIKQEGYEPVLLEPYCGFNMRWYFRKFHDKELRKILGKKTKFPEIIMAKRNYSDTLEQIRKLNPVLIIPGSDRGIELAAKLSHDLGLTGNDPKNLPKMRDKFIAQQALKNNGVRSIEGKIVSSAKEAVEFFNEMQKNGKSVIVKPVSGIASYGVFVCNTEQEVIKAYNKNATNKLYASYSANKKSVLIQECINGEEYVVNSVSCGGVHKITMILKYRKETAYNGGKIYNSDISVDLQSDLAKALADYQINLFNAIRVKYNIVKSENMDDENSTVLIEAN
ncbi:MAG: ATP-grasp domain-containing protein, partial [Clostridia bacterium]|nr:ATP-grasp domain-containing protein [Clostridia bacterium]